MAESMRGFKRSHYCGDLGLEQAGQEVFVTGWVQKARNKGGLIFVDLRDRQGLLQILFEEKDCGAEVFAKAAELRAEFVIAVGGRLEKRGGAVNTQLATGEVELRAQSLRILSQAATPPFPIEAESRTKEELRLQYRYLDLRRPDLQRNLLLRSQVSGQIRAYLAQEGFVEIETPILNKATPEGARDYLVPSRVHPGSFYALPQSPQLFKQLLMCAGYDRYVQIARCFRDEDLRADRQPEFTQVDLEMSFVEEADVMAVTEGMVAEVCGKALGREISLPLPRMSWQEAMDRFGSDKPDTRFGMELTDISSMAAGCGFGVFAQAVEEGGSVRAIVAKGQASMPRKKIDAWVEFAKGYGAKGLAYAGWEGDGAWKSSFGKFVSPEWMEEMAGAVGAQEGDMVFLAAGPHALVWNVLGALRCQLAQELGLIDGQRFDFLWITDFPLLEWDEEAGRYVAKHHPFTMPVEEDIPLLESRPAQVRARAYDIVLNGVELGGGSIRIHQKELQERMFSVLGFSQEEAREKFGFLLSAFQYGVPPHGGLAIGLDRFVMLLAGAENIREVIAFPKVKDASCLMTQAPGAVEEAQLQELHICLAAEE